MAEITRRRTGELIRGVFEILSPHPEGLAAKEVLRQLEQKVPPTEFEKRSYPRYPDQRKYETIVRFSTIDSVKAGWLVKAAGRWRLTEEGRRAVAKWKNPEEFMREANRRYREWDESRPEEPAAPEPEAEPVTKLEEAEEAAWSVIESHLQEMPPYDLQDLVRGLLEAMGYHVAWVAPPGPDGGIDLVAHSDPLGTSTPRIKVQVKRSAAVNSAGLRSFLGVLGDQDVGIFISTGGFTTDAKTEARKQEKRRVTLIDMEALFSLWTQHYARISEKCRAYLPIRAVYFLAPRN